MVYKNRSEMGARWCMKPTEGWVDNGVQNGVQKPPLGGGGLCTETIIGRVWDGVQKLLLGRCTVMYKNYR